MTVSPDLQRRLSELSDLPSPPKVAMQLVDLARDPDVTIDAIATTIEYDPALAAKVLRVANSAHYARNQRCDSVRRALITLGLKATLSTALSFSLVSSLRQQRPGEFDYARFWKRSVMAAVAARELGAMVGHSDWESLFLGALLQDIGVLALNALEPSAYADFDGDVGNRAQLERFETERFGDCHTDVGAWLLVHWNLPEPLPYAVAMSHRPADVDPEHEAGTFARCVSIAGLFADVWFSADTPSAFIDVVRQCESVLGLGPADTGIALARVRESAPETAAMFDMTTLTQSQLQKVVNDAKEILLASNAAALEEAAKLREALASYQDRAASL